MGRPFSSGCQPADPNRPTFSGAPNGRAGSTTQGSKFAVKHPPTHHLSGGCVTERFPTVSAGITGQR